MKNDQASHRSEERRETTTAQITEESSTTCAISNDDGRDISCMLHGGSQPALIFTHGAGGTITSDAMSNFASGFAKTSSILCFQGNMNLKSRTKAFTAVIADQSKHGAACSALGGRSMGARAAVMAATDKTECLILVSYPLHTDKGQMRDEILLQLPMEKEVLFISGDRDTMCDLTKLNQVRQRMKCKTWMVKVKGADHGMGLKPSRGTKVVGKETGLVAAEWLRKRDHKSTECEIVLEQDEEDSTAKRSKWIESADIADKKRRSDEHDHGDGKRRKSTRNRK